LIIKLAKENSWGYTRIVGELRKAANLLGEQEHGPQHPEGTWPRPLPQSDPALPGMSFVSRHAASLWQADFVSQKVLTMKGIREAFCSGIPAYRD